MSVRLKILNVSSLLQGEDLIRIWAPQVTPLKIKKVYARVKLHICVNLIGNLTPNSIATFILTSRSQKGRQMLNLIPMHVTNVENTSNFNYNRFSTGKNNMIFILTCDTLLSPLG